MIYYRGRWLIEPEIKALLTKLEDLNKELRLEADRVLRENAELRAKVESANRIQRVCDIVKNMADVSTEGEEIAEYIRNELEKMVVQLPELPKEG